MSSGDWDPVMWQRANALLRQAERIQRNFIQIAVNSQYSSWEPPVNIVETEEGLWVIVALPGVKADGIDLRVQGNHLMIAGETPLPSCCRDGDLKVWEIQLGRFKRVIGPFATGRSLVLEKSTLEDGLLIIELRKKL